MLHTGTKSNISISVMNKIPLETLFSWSDIITSSIKLKLFHTWHQQEFCGISETINEEYDNMRKTNYGID